MNENKTNLDLIWGAENIAVELNLVDRDGRPNVRRAFYLLQTKQIPAKKMGAAWVSSRSLLRQHIIDEMRGAA